MLRFSRRGKARDSSASFGDFAAGRRKRQGRAGKASHSARVADRRQQGGTAHGQLPRERQRQLIEMAHQRATALQAALDNMVDGVFVCDTTGHLTLVNEAGLRLLGLCSLAEVNFEVAALASRLRMRQENGRPVAAADLPLARALAGETVTLEKRIVYNGRSQRDVFIRSTAAPIRDAAGGIIGAVEVARDATEQFEVDRLKDQFISLAAHELKTPLAIMKGYAQALLRLDAGMPPQRRVMLEAIDAGADRVNGIIKDLLDISRLELGQLDLEVERIELDTLVVQVVEQMVLAAPRHCLHLRHTEPAVVRGDRSRLEQVLVNLLDNAVKYSPEASDVEVTVTVVGAQVVVAVKDYGLGIPLDKQGRIFERFFSAHNCNPYNCGGVGVGLHISRAIVERQGGRMWFESAEGSGSTFYFALPLA